MERMQAPPQPGSPQQAPRMLPLGALGTYLLAGALFCVIATLGFVWLAAGAVADRFITLDDAIVMRAQTYWGPTLAQVMLSFTTMGETLTLSLIVGLVALLLLRRGRWIDAAGLVVAGAGAGILNQVLKALYHRVRPDLVSGPFHLTSYSFPSGHSMGSIACYGMLAFLTARMLPGRAQRAVVFLAAALLVLGVGSSRVYFGVHFPTDVLGGFTAGAIWLAITIVGMRAAEWYAERRVGWRARSARER